MNRPQIIHDISCITNKVDQLEAFLLDPTCPEADIREAKNQIKQMVDSIERLK